MKSWFSGRWLWLSACHQWWIRWSRLYIHEFPQIIIARWRYPQRLKKIRMKVCNRKLRVLFSVSNLAKWKMQTVFDAMRNSDLFDPIIMLTVMDTELVLSGDDLKSHLTSVRQEFERRKMKCVVGYDLKKQTHIPIVELEPDIVFYQQPFGIDISQNPFSASRVALTCYVPYFVQNYGGLDMDCGYFFHRLLWCYFTLSPSWAQIFEDYQGVIRRAGHVVGLGHPMLDQLSTDKMFEDVNGYVIYAPHWSCGNVCERYSTFIENGEKMLALAKRHPELKWAFKPHPTLRQTLIQYKFMSEAQVFAYYSEWERIGTACYGDYVELFKKSSVLITDSASFLVEYACTRRPIIHLIAKNPEYQPHPIASKLFGTYYQAHDWREFEKYFDEVVVQKKDVKKEARLCAAKELNLLGMAAGKKIVSYLEENIGGLKK